SEEHRALAEQAAANGSLHVTASTAAGPAAATTITVVTAGGPGVLAPAAGVLALHSLQVHSADIRVLDLPTGGSAAVDTFAVSPRFGRLPDVALLRQDLVRALDGSLELAERLAAKERDYGEVPRGKTAESDTGSAHAPAKVLWFDDEAAAAVILELRTTDRIGLLYRVAAALQRSAVTVRWARVVTLGSSVVDSFCITGSSEHGALSAKARELVERAVLSVL
ncbi:MAG: [protein-PII] uridylyltransferase, partial [Actinomycetota bacterium]|nr:[protein-PII] uridylyltransferase [Actinomycetota bacterium]